MTAAFVASAIGTPSGRSKAVAPSASRVAIARSASVAPMLSASAARDVTARMPSSRLPRSLGSMAVKGCFLTVWPIGSISMTTRVGNPAGTLTTTSTPPACVATLDPVASRPGTTWRAGTDIVGSSARSTSGPARSSSMAPRETRTASGPARERSTSEAPLRSVRAHVTRPRRLANRPSTAGLG